MTGLVDGQLIDWDFIAKQCHPAELKRATSGLIAATKPPRPAATQVPPVAAAEKPTVLEQTRLVARAGMAARDLGHAIANNMRQLHEGITQ